MNELLHRGLKDILVAPWSRVAATRDLPTIAFFRAGGLLRRGVPVPGILATHRPGAIMDKSGRRFRLSGSGLGQLPFGKNKRKSAKSRCGRTEWPKPMPPPDEAPGDNVFDLPNEAGIEA